MISLDKFDWVVGKISGAKFKHHFYLKSNPSITMEIDVNKVCHGTVGEYEQHKGGFRTVLVNFLSNGEVFCERKVMLLEDHGYVAFPIITKVARDEALIIYKNDEKHEVKYTLQYDHENYLLARMVTDLIVWSRNTMKVMDGKSEEQHESKDFHKLFRKTHHISHGSNKCYHLIEFNGELFSDRDKVSIDKSVEWED